MKADGRIKAGTVLAVVAVLLFIPGSRWMVARDPIRSYPVNPLEVARAAQASLRGFWFLAAACLSSVVAGWILSRTHSRWPKMSAWLCFWAAGNSLAIIVVGENVVSGFHSYYGRDHHNTCIGNLMKIRDAKGQWALETRAPKGATPNDSDLFGASLYLAEKPVCPWGGLYMLKPVGIPPVCTVPGHTLP